jgi:hypothetical protein
MDLLVGRVALSCVGLLVVTSIAGLNNKSGENCHACFLPAFLGNPLYFLSVSLTVRGWSVDDLLSGRFASRAPHTHGLVAMFPGCLDRSKIMTALLVRVHP